MNSCPELSWEHIVLPAMKEKLCVGFLEHSITKCHRLGGLKKRGSVSSQFQRLQVQGEDGSTVSSFRAPCLNLLFNCCDKNTRLKVTWGDRGLFGFNEGSQGRNLERRTEVEECCLPGTMDRGRSPPSLIINQENLPQTWWWQFLS